MASDSFPLLFNVTGIKLNLREDLLEKNAIVLETDDYAETELEFLESYDGENYPAELLIYVHSKTGEILVIILKEFKDCIKEAIQALRDNPLPWTFSVPGMKIKEKPLEDVLLAIWKKYKGVKMEWE